MSEKLLIVAVDFTVTSDAYNPSSLILNLITMNMINELNGMVGQLGGVG